MNEIRTILGASTGNISYADKICLEEDPGHYCAYPKIDRDGDEEYYGWVMNITHYKYDEAYLSDIKEESIRTLIEKGLELGVDWIDIDRDAEPVEGLPTYGWYRFYDLQAGKYSEHDVIEDLFVMICDGYCECGEGHDILDESDGEMKCINCWNINNVDKVSLEEMKNEIAGHDYIIEAV